MTWLSQHRLTAVLIVLLLAAAVFLTIMLCTPPKQQPAKVVVYKQPGSIAPNKEIAVWVEEAPLFVYETAVNHNRRWSESPDTSTAAMSYFDFEGRVKVEVSAQDVQSAVVRPLSLGITPQVKDGVASFWLDRPAHLTIELNGDYTRALHLFANPLETEIPDEDDPNVLYFGPGVYETGIFEVKSGQTVYLAGGAVVYGGIIGDGVENVRVMGRGLFDGGIYDRWAQTTVPVNFKSSKDIHIEGIGFMNPAGWTVNAYFCKDVTVDNIKIITARSNGDGVTLQSCSDVMVTNSFVRTWDDSLVVKNYDNGNTDEIRFENIVVWTDLAQSCEVGYETYGDSMQNITFENITVLHNFHKPVMSIHNSDQAEIRNVTFKGITVEDAQMGDGDGTPYLMEVTIASSQWSKAPARGLVDGVLFEDIAVLGGKIPGSNFRGYNENSMVRNIAINNLTIGRQRITNMAQGKIQALLYAENITIDGVRQGV